MQLFDRIGDLHSQMYGRRTAEKREYTFFREVYAGFVGHPPGPLSSIPKQASELERVTWEFPDDNVRNGCRCNLI